LRQRKYDRDSDSGRKPEAKSDFEAMYKHTSWATSHFLIQKDMS